jgi:hypothetical protein
MSPMVHRSPTSAVRALLLVALVLTSACASSRAVAPPSRESTATTHGVHALAAAPEVGDREEVAATGCGIERWAIKTGTDADRFKVNRARVVDTTIASMRGRARPSSLPSAHRIAPVETTVWREYALLVEYKLEADSDIHLVLKNHAGQTMIAEIPSPKCVGSTSLFRSSISAARSAFAAKYSATGSWKSARSRYIRLRGVGFFDYFHGQTGVAPNGIELHPVIAIAFPVPIARPLAISRQSGHCA